MKNCRKHTRGRLRVGLVSGAALLATLGVSALGLAAPTWPADEFRHSSAASIFLALSAPRAEAELLPPTEWQVVQILEAGANGGVLDITEISSLSGRVANSVISSSLSQAKGKLLAETQLPQPQAAAVTGGALTDAEAAEPSLVNINSLLELTFADATAASILLLEDEFTFSINEGKFTFAVSRAARLVFDLVENAVIPPGELISGTVHFVVQHPISYTEAEQAVVSVTAEGQLHLLEPSGGLPQLSQPVSYTATGFLDDDEVPIEVSVLADTNYVLD